MHSFANYWPKISGAWAGTGCETKCSRSAPWLIASGAQRALRTQQRLDRAALVDRAVTLRYLIERHGEIEDLAGVDLPVLMECQYAHRHLHRPSGELSVESEGRREVPVGVDLRLQIGDLLLREGNGIGAGR